uniref:Uncharacterized protein n=1 Tax=Graphocephala atropunctata TaxID=36148 RepID=A0A1B6ME78_9HEMI
MITLPALFFLAAVTLSFGDGNGTVVKRSFKNRNDPINKPLGEREEKTTVAESGDKETSWNPTDDKGMNELKLLVSGRGDDTKEEVEDRRRKPIGTLPCHYNSRCIINDISESSFRSSPENN